MILTSKTSNIPWGASNIACTVHAWIWRVFASRFLTRHCAWNMEPVCNCHRFLVCSFKSCGSWWRSPWVSRGESLQFAVLFTRPVYLKIGGWETTFLLGSPIFRGYVSFRECSSFVQCLTCLSQSTWFIRFRTCNLRTFFVSVAC